MLTWWLDDGDWFIGNGAMVTSGGVVVGNGGSHCGSGTVNGTEVRGVIVSSHFCGRW